MANDEKLGTCDRLGASPRSGMGAREFAAEHVEWLQRITPTGSSKAENDPFAFAEAYAADQVRQARDAKNHEIAVLNLELLRFQTENAQLRQERDDDEQMWRERCDAASKAGYEVAMEQEREARERVEGALREIVHSVGKLAEDSGEDWRLKHAELMDAYEAGVLAVKSSEGEAK